LNNLVNCQKVTRKYLNSINYCFTEPWELTESPPP
jgi:hypothetical protein